MASSRPRAFLDISINAEPAGRLVLELFADQTRKTCQNFLAICNGSHAGLTYAGSSFHRIIDEFMIQGGDITKGDGTGGESIFGGEFGDENLSWRDMDAAGLVCMANRGKDTNSSQFFITLEPCPHLNGKHTIFGRLVSGQDVLSRIATTPVDKDDCPTVPVLIARCGELERKQKPHEPSRAQPTERKAALPEPSRRARSPSRERRRRRRSRSSSADKTERRPRGGASPELDIKDEPPRSRSPHRRQDRRRSRSRSGSHDRKRESHRSHRDRRDGSRNRNRDGPDNPRGRASRDQDWRRDDRDADRSRRYDGHRGGRRHDTRRNDNDRGFRSRANDRPDGNEGRLSGAGGGRLGGSDDAGNGEGIKFKGRGSMKFREPGSNAPQRRW